MTQPLTILILEDDLLTLSVLLKKLAEYELTGKRLGSHITFSPIILSQYIQVEKYINKTENNYFDIILLDRDCKVGGSFHVLDFSKIDKETIISISSMPAYNEEMKHKGITHIVQKAYEDLDLFADKVINEIRVILEAKYRQ